MSLFLVDADLDAKLSGMSAKELHEVVAEWGAMQCDHPCPHNHGCSVCDMCDCGTCVRVESGEGCWQREMADEVVIAAIEEQALRSPW